MASIIKGIASQIFAAACLINTLKFFNGEIDIYKISEFSWTNESQIITFLNVDQKQTNIELLVMYNKVLLLDNSKKYILTITYDQIIFTMYRNLIM